MIDAFETTARLQPDDVFFTYINASGAETTYTYRHARIAAAALACRFQAEGLRAGDMVVVDLPNGPEFIFTALACAYGSYTLAALNCRLSDHEKDIRLRELEQSGCQSGCQPAHQSECQPGCQPTPQLTPQSTHQPAPQPAQQSTHRRIVVVDKEYAHEALRVACNSSARAEDIAAHTYSEACTNSAVTSGSNNALSDVILFAEHGAHTFNSRAYALMMCTSGTTGKPKIVPLTWENLVGSASIANQELDAQDHVLWQAVLPFYHIGGFQVIVRTVLAHASMIVYERFSGERVLRDAQRFHATHVSVVDKMLQDMFSVIESSSCEKDAPAQWGSYRCILLGGASLNPKTTQRAIALSAPVYASYGMTETSSAIAAAPITATFDGGLKLFAGYEARVIDADDQNSGRLVVAGPGVFADYRNARATFTTDGFFVTGDTAVLRDGCLFVKERTNDMFVSGGENVYPAEIVQFLLTLQGVSDACVFAVSSPVWGRRPVAVVESVSCDPLFIKQQAAQHLSAFSCPDDVLVVPALPRTGVGKIDRQQAQQLYENRLDVRRVVLHHIRVPFKKPFTTAQTTLLERDSLIVEVIDHKGRVGLGECVAFETDWYLSETLPEDARVLQQTLAPAVVGRSFAHPRDVASVLAKLSDAASHPMAICAIEMALWDLYGRITNTPLWRLVREQYHRERPEGPIDAKGKPLTCAASFEGNTAVVPAGVAIGIAGVQSTLAEVGKALNEGYRRIKMKVSPGQGVEAVRAVRHAFPEAIITLDANCSYAADNFDELKAYDDFNISWIEEPIDTTTGASHNAQSALSCLNKAQSAMSCLNKAQTTLRTPICVDESYENLHEAFHLLTHPNLRCIAIKIGKFGGIAAAVSYIAHAQRAGCEVWMAGMFENGISRRMHAAFETLPGVVMPGDISDIGRYLTIDITEPAYASRGGYVVLNGQGMQGGLGCTLNAEAMERVTVSRVVIGQADASETV